MVGVGCRPGTSAAAVREVVTALLERHGLSLGAVRAFATVSARAREPGLRAVAGDRLLAYPPEVLDRVEVSHRSARVAAAVGTASVAEAAAMHAAAVLAGPDGDATLVAGRFSGAAVTAAVARVVERTGRSLP